MVSSDCVEMVTVTGVRFYRYVNHGQVVWQDEFGNGYDDETVESLLQNPPKRPVFTPAFFMKMILGLIVLLAVLRFLV